MSEQHATFTVNRPVPFSGTPEQAQANYETHWWTRVDEYEIRCGQCDCKPWHAAAKYPCGNEPPRETITYKGTE